MKKRSNIEIMKLEINSSKDVLFKKLTNEELEQITGGTRETEDSSSQSATITVEGFFRSSIFDNTPII